jgi:alpha-N-arabinofuranosidase
MTLYWVYWLYKVHRNATLLPVSLTCSSYELNDRKLDAVSVSASRDASGKIHLTLVNIDLNRKQTVESELQGVTIRNVSGKVLTSANLADHNTFDRPDTFGVKDFKGV